MLKVAISSLLGLPGTFLRCVTYPKPWNLVLSNTCFLTSSGLNSLRHFNAPSNCSLALLTWPWFARRNFWRMRSVLKGAAFPLRVVLAHALYTMDRKKCCMYSSTEGESSTPNISLYPASAISSPSLADILSSAWPSGRLSQSEPDFWIAASTLALSSAALTPGGV